MTARHIHLHLHSEFSLIDSTIRINGLIAAAVRAQMPALALTDECNMFAFVKFYKACMAAGIKPIGGCDLWISAADDPRPWRLTVLCQNHAGYLNLSRLVSRAWRDGQRAGRALVETSWLTPDTTAGLIALVGRESQVARIAVQQGTPAALPETQALAQLFDDRLYLELTRCGRAGEEDWNAVALPLASALSLPIVASNDVRFLRRRRFRSARSARMHPSGPRARRSETPARLQRPSNI